MDAAVGLVQSYLHVNGYFTVAEYPVLEARRQGGATTVTDIDILAFRFAGAGHDVVAGHGRQRLAGGELDVDPALGAEPGRPDMIVGEVKQGRARLNQPLRQPEVLEVVLTRFGCCPAQHAHELVRELIARGRARTPAGHAVRMVAFGGGEGTGSGTGPCTIVPMSHVVSYLQQYLRQHWSVLRHAQLRDPALDILALLQKWGVEPTPHATGRE